MTIDEMYSERTLPAVVADARGMITYVNAPFEQAFKWAASDIVGKSLTAIIPRSFHDAHNLGFARFLTTTKGTLLNQPLKLRAVARDGQEFDAEHVITAEQRGGVWVFGATIRPLGAG